jgi:two-component system LytT family response regulator
LEKIRTVIVDDEPLARQGVRRLLEEDTDVEVVGEAEDGLEAVDLLRERHPDLVFLDIQMPEKDGFEVLSALEPDALPLVVFVTAYDQHALHAFEVHALDYLLKPFDADRFRETLGRAKGRLQKHNGGELTDRILTMLGQLQGDQGKLDRFLIKAGGRITFLRTEEVEWIEAQGDYVCLHAGGKKHLLREKMADLESRLPADRFLRIHRSTIVNIDRIREMQPLFYGEYAVLLQDGTRLTLSRSYRDRVFQRLGRE